MRDDVARALARGDSADLAGRTIDITTIVDDPTERGRVMALFVEQFNQRYTPDSPYPIAVLDEWVDSSPLARVDFLDND